jgi:hypothetical protein
MMTSKGKLVTLVEELVVVALYLPQIPYDSPVLNLRRCGDKPLSYHLSYDMVMP